MQLSSPLTKQLNIDYPIIQAGMAGSTTPELVAAVCNAGGLGMIGAGYFDDEKLENEIDEVNQLTNKPFAVNLFVPSNNEVDNGLVEHMKEWLKPYRKAFNLEEPVVNITEQQQFDRAIDIIIKKKVSIVTFTFGIPNKETISKLKAHDITLIGTAASVDEAQANEEAGMDIVVAQGSEAGGHRGSFLNTSNDNALVGVMSLVPQIVDNIAIPVVAAGGIMDGRGLVASMVLGAQAVQMGTAFLTTLESGANNVLRNAILNSKETDTVVTPVFSGKPARGIDNEFIHEMGKYDDIIPSYPIQNQLTNGIRKAAVQKGDANMTHLWSGQSPRLAQSVSVDELIQQIIAQSTNVLQN